MVAKQNAAHAETVAGISEETNAAMEEVADALTKLSKMSESLHSNMQKFVI